jgi:hypothetical protein
VVAVGDLDVTAAAKASQRAAGQLLGVLAT